MCGAGTALRRSRVKSGLTQQRAPGNGRLGTDHSQSRPHGALRAQGRGGLTREADWEAATPPASEARAASLCGASYGLVPHVPMSAEQREAELASRVGGRTPRRGLGGAGGPPAQGTLQARGPGPRGTVGRLCPGSRRLLTLVTSWPRRAPPTPVVQAEVVRTVAERAGEAAPGAAFWVQRRRAGQRRGLQAAQRRRPATPPPASQPRISGSGRPELLHAACVTPKTPSRQRSRAPWGQDSRRVCPVACVRNHHPPLCPLPRIREFGAARWPGRKQRWPPGHPVRGCQSALPQSHREPCHSL